MPLDFPTSPTLNEIYTYSGRSWKWNGTAWDVYIASGNFVNTLNGFTGGVTLAAGSNVTVTNAANIITIASSSSGGITGNYVSTFNGLTGSVSGVTTTVSNTFVPIQSFSGGITTNGITSTGNIIHVSSGSSFINDQVFLGGVTGSNVIIGTSGHLTNAEVRVMSDEGTVGITSTGDITIGTANGVINFIGNLNITGQVLVNGAIITKTGFYGFTGDSDEEPIDYVTLDGGQF